MYSYIATIKTQNCSIITKDPAHTQFIFISPPNVYPCLLVATDLFSNCSFTILKKMLYKWNYKVYIKSLKTLKYKTSWYWLLFFTEHNALKSSQVVVFINCSLLFIAESYSTVGFLRAETVKNLPARQETQVRSLGQEDPLEKGMATHCSILAGELHGQWSQAGYNPWVCKVGHDWATNIHTTVFHGMNVSDYWLFPIWCYYK